MQTPRLVTWDRGSVSSRDVSQGRKRISVRSSLEVPVGNTTLSVDDVDLASLFAADGHPISYYTAIPGAPSISTIKRAIRAGSLPATRVGRTLYIAPRDFADWAQSRRVAVGVRQDG